MSKTKTHYTDYQRQIIIDDLLLSIKSLINDLQKNKKKLC